jgi:hypothetical protein
MTLRAIPRQSGSWLQVCRSCNKGHLDVLLGGNPPEIDHFKPKKTKDKVLTWCIIIAGIILAIMLLQGCAQAYSDQDAIKVIVGESSNQGLKGMICVGEVIRHNTSLRGFYGLHASHSAKEGAKTWAMAKLAWYKSKYTNYTHNANHFENIRAFGRPYWVKKCILTFEYKDHKFFREVK